MQAYKIHIPEKFNDGKLIPKQAIQDMLSQTLELFGGYTFNPMPVMGAWRDGDKDYIEKMYVLEVATGDYETLEKHVQHMRDVFQQECMYLVKLGKVSFV